MKKAIIGIVFGILAGIIDITPMILQKLSWDANISAFTMWVISGFFISTTELKINGIAKGVLISFLLLTPCAILIAWKEPKSLIPISIMTLLLGALLGFAINKVGKTK
jgi:drug/metabolite transporter (DMT)-like permease